MSLARVTVLSSTGSILLDEHIRPPTGVTILDLNTRFSGVQDEDLEKAVLDVNGVRKALAQFVDEKTVFVGHGLENDLKALRLVHTRVIDTAIVSQAFLSLASCELRWTPRSSSSSHIRTAAPGVTRCATSQKTS